MALSARKDKNGRFIVSLWFNEREITFPGFNDTDVNASASPSDEMIQQEIAFSFSNGKFKQTSGLTITSIKDGWRLLEALNKISGKNATIIANKVNDYIYNGESYAKKQRNTFEQGVADFDKKFNDVRANQERDGVPQTGYIPEFNEEKGKYKKLGEGIGYKLNSDVKGVIAGFIGGGRTRKRSRHNKRKLKRKTKRKYKKH
jgi:hypothetical protein